ncbi:MAG: AAA family ATPase, partial [Candidatus Aenigmarchaeota archaeon]|nr:AAA family ATPase [Candidatus Aenigmarchaeota archaeon]
MITKVKIKGWRSHKDSEFVFSRGTNVLIGVMGAGKSSILDAISFALFGTFPSLQSRKVSLDDIIMNRPKKEDTMEVSVSFTMNSDEYTVKRIVGRGKGTIKAEIRKNGKLLETGTTRTTEEVERILKMNYDLFSRAIYSEQNGLDYFLRLAKGQRMKKIDDLLQIDRFESARTSTTTMINRIKNTISDKEKIIDEMERKEDFERIPKIKKEIEGLKEEKEKLASEMKKIDEERTKVENELKDLNELTRELESLERKRNMVVGEIKTLEDYLKEGLSMKKIEDVKNEIEENSKKIEEYQDKLKSLKEELERTSEEKQKINVLIEDLVSKIEKLKSVEGKCPVCDRELTDDHKKMLINQRKNTITEKESELKDVLKKLKSIKDEINNLENSIELEKKKSYELKEIERKIKDIESKRKKYEELKEVKEQLDAKISENKKLVNQEYINSLRKRLIDLSGKYMEYKSKIDSNDRFIREKNEQLESLVERKKAFEKYKDELKKMKEILENLKKLEKALKETQITLRSEFVGAVNSVMNQIWEQLYPYDDYTGIRLSIKEGDYVLELRDPSGNWITVEGVA